MTFSSLNAPTADIKSLRNCLISFHDARIRDILAFV
jgi:hypothetical protein